jgi:ubiquitin-conjugating enzyme E2 D/E
MNNNEYAEFNLSTNIFSIINDIKIKLVQNKFEGEKIIKDQQEADLEKYKKIDNLGLIKYKSEHFILMNSIKPIFEEKDWNGESSSKIRFLKEFSDLTKDLLYEGFQIYGIRNNKCIGVIEGPPQTPYEKGFFLFEIILSREYPFNISKFYFITKIFHPNIGEDGLLSIYLEGSTDRTGFCHPTFTLGNIVLSIQSILDDPNPDDFLNEKAAKLYKENRKKYEETAKEYTLKYATFLNLQNELNKYKFNIEHVQDIN